MENKTALFTNFSDQEFTGYWDGKPYHFKAGQSKYMHDWMARHFAKHLTNQELLRVDAQGNLMHKDGDKMTSPKFPEQVPVYMELFNKAYTPDKSKEKENELDVELELMNLDKEVKVETSKEVDEFENQPIEK